MAEIIVILFEIQRDKAVQSYTNLSRSYAMFVPQLNKAPKKGCKYMYADPLEGLPHRLVMHDVIANLYHIWRDKVVQRRTNCPETVQD